MVFDGDDGMMVHISIVSIILQLVHKKFSETVTSMKHNVATYWAVEKVKQF